MDPDFPLVVSNARGAIPQDAEERLFLGYVVRQQHIRLSRQRHFARDVSDEHATVLFRGNEHTATLVACQDAEEIGGASDVLGAKEACRRKGVDDRRLAGRKGDVGGEHVAVVSYGKRLGPRYFEKRHIRTEIARPQEWDFREVAIGRNTGVLGTRTRIGPQGIGAALWEHTDATLLGCTGVTFRGCTDVTLSSFLLTFPSPVGGVQGDLPTAGSDQGEG
jgi:hypothetical protein